MLVEIEHEIDPQWTYYCSKPTSSGTDTSGAMRYPVINEFYSRRVFAMLLSLWLDSVPIVGG